MRSRGAGGEGDIKRRGQRLNGAVNWPWIGGKKKRSPSISLNHSTIFGVCEWKRDGWLLNRWDRWMGWPGVVRSPPVYLQSTMHGAGVRHRAPWPQCRQRHGTPTREAPCGGTTAVSGWRRWRLDNGTTIIMSLVVVVAAAAAYVWHVP